MPLLPKDPALLQGFRRGEQAALERVYWGYVDRVEAVVRHGFQIVNREARSGVRVEGVRAEDVADVVQETFARAFSERARLAYDGVRDYGPFLVTITRNLLIDRARRLGREVSLDTLGEDWDPGSAAEAEESWADAATMQAVADYLTGLPPELRRVHEQRYVRCASQEEAARVLGLSRQQLRTLERRLREGLSRHMAQACGANQPAESERRMEKRSNAR